LQCVGLKTEQGMKPRIVLKIYVSVYILIVVVEKLRVVPKLTNGGNLKFQLKINAVGLFLLITCYIFS
jgi:hypothetical protein